jgi:transglutaminase-like putative cysteine protease
VRRAPPPRPTEIRKLIVLRGQAYDDALDPAIVEMASTLARPFAPDDYLAIAREIFRWVRDGIRYQRDPGLREEFASAGEVLKRGWDDCDGKVKLAVAMLRSVGMTADVHPVWRGGNLTHVQLRVRWPGSTKVPGNVNGWIIGDETIKGAELTQNPRAVASNPDTGKLPLSGGPSKRSPLD